MSTADAADAGFSASVSFVAMAIVPDTKDWTWVLERQCPECGYEAGTVGRDELPVRIRAAAATVGHELLGRSDVRQRPAPDVWSALEYGCHLRDVFRRFDRRLEQMLTEDDPRFENWDQDATAVELRYGEQDPATVATELERAADRVAERFAAVEGPQWTRPGRRSDGARFTVESLGRYLVHDAVHHVWDLTGRRADEG
jgi:hypothetical protein